jgi:Predicted choline kinase involved in LPS biosynthesis
MGDRFFDLANFSVNHEFGVEDDRRFLGAYFGVERESDLAGLRLMRYMSDFREAMWGVLQSGISDLDFDFAGYAHKHFARMEGTASELSLRASSAAPPVSGFSARGRGSRVGCSWRTSREGSAARSRRAAPRSAAR